MTKRKKLIAGILVAAMALTGVLVGTISADDQGSANPQTTLLARVAEILGINQTDLQNAFQQAMTEERDARQAEMQAAQDARLQNLIDQGVLTQEQVDQWKAWLEARPDNSDAMKAWLAERPDMGDASAAAPGLRNMLPGRLGGRGMMPGGGTWGGRGFGGQCPAPEAAA
jgi:hypothetical protein